MLENPLKKSHFTELRAKRATFSYKNPSNSRFIEVHIRNETFFDNLRHSDILSDQGQMVCDIPIPTRIQS